MKTDFITISSALFELNLMVKFYSLDSALKNQILAPSSDLVEVKTNQPLKVPNYSRSISTFYMRVISDTVPSPIVTISQDRKARVQEVNQIKVLSSSGKELIVGVYA
jgi:hypothetical protein